MELLEELEALIKSPRGLPGMRRVLVNQERLLEMVDKLRVAVPHSVQEAEAILQKREEIVSQALVEARRVKASADDEARSRVDENEIIKEAQQSAEEIIAETQRRAQRILQEADAEAEARRQGADKYAREILYKLEDQLSGFLNAVRRGIDVLELEREPTEG